MNVKTCEHSIFFQLLDKNIFDGIKCILNIFEQNFEQHRVLNTLLKKRQKLFRRQLAF